MGAALDFKPTSATLSTSLSQIPDLRQRIQGIVPETGGFGALSHAAEIVYNRREPAWVDSQLAKLDVGLKKTKEGPSVSSSDLGGRAFEAREGHLEVGMCRELCEQGRISDVVDVLSLLVQRGCHVPNDLFCRILKRCITHKDLVSGRCIHALIVKIGYEGDTFLANQLIGLYASHGRLEEAIRVFTTIPTPDAHNWATIIFAYSRREEAAGAAEAIRLYRYMCESSTVKPDNHIYSAVLKACATLRDLVAGKEVHSHIVASSRNPDKFVQAGLVNMYAKCGSLQDARRVFDEVPERNAVTWTAMIAGYAQQGMGEEALTLYSSMQEEGLISPDSVTYVCLLQACASLGVGALDEGRQFHAQIKTRGLQVNVVLAGSLVNMYAKCGSLEDARRLFETLPKRNAVTWNAMIAGYAQQGMGHEALSIYSSMKQEGLIAPDPVTYACLLQACASVGVQALHQGKQLHAQIKQQRLQEDVVLGGSLVNMYAKCGSLDAARKLFDELPERNVVAWTAMLAGYAQQGMGKEALCLYGSMQQEGLTPPNAITYACLLQACGTVGVEALPEGKQLHEQIRERGLEDDVVLGSSLVDMYAKCGSLDDARQLFDRLPERTVVACTAMIAGYAQQGMGKEALAIYSSMQHEGVTDPNPVTYLCLLQACSTVGVGALHEGKQLHAQIKERGLQEDVALGGSLVNMYGKCGSLQDARQLFNRLPEKNVVTWSVMIAGYSEQGMGEEAFRLYNIMQQEGVTPPNSVTYLCLLNACASVGKGALHQGKQLHAKIKEQGLEVDVVLGSSLVNMYAKCGSLENARHLFDRLPQRNVVTWTVMIAGYVEQEMGEEALGLYSNMQWEGLTAPDSVTYVCLLQACAVVAALSLGQQLHAEIQNRGMQGDVVLGSALVNMYAKCGSMSDSQQVFDLLSERRVEAWGALIGGYARHGDSEAVFNLLDRMTLEGIQPDGITFLSVLTVCSHMGLVDEGRKYYEAMTTDYGITTTVDHLTCMMDLLGRAGHLGEALQLAKTMPCPPNGAVWLTLLSACRKWNNVEVGQHAFDFAVKLDAKDAAPYVLMSNIYARAEMWEEAGEMQARRKECGASKKPGQSWCTGMGGVVHTFVSGDKKHPESEGFYASLQQLVPKMKKERYVPHLSLSSPDIIDAGKEAEL